LKKQKGTGTARAGSIKSPLMRGGARVFGPTPRDYSFKLNKKVKQLARKSALAYKVQNNQVIIVEDFNFEAPKTKEFIALKNNLKIYDKKALLVLSNQNKNIYLSARNLERTLVSTASDLTTYDIVNSTALLLSESSLGVLEQLFSTNNA